MENVSQVLEEIEEEYRILRDLGDHPNMPGFLGIYLKGGEKGEESGGRRHLRGEEQVWIVMEVRLGLVTLEYQGSMCDRINRKIDPYNSIVMRSGDPIMKAISIVYNGDPYR